VPGRDSQARSGAALLCQSTECPYACGSRCAREGTSSEAEPARGRRGPSSEAEARSRGRVPSSVADLDRGGHEPSSEADRLEGHPGHSVLPNRSVRFLGTLGKSVPRELGTDRYPKRMGRRLAVAVLGLCGDAEARRGGQTGSVRRRGEPGRVRRVECLSAEGHAVDAGRGLGADGGRPCGLQAARGAGCGGQTREREPGRCA
jgi:hypothetical protein